jgi:small redox-active disulfide protein 2
MEIEIKVLGPGCPRCQKTEEIVLEAVREAGVEAEVTKVKDTMEIAKAGVFMTPAVMVNGEVKCVGKVPGKEEVVKWITT